MKQIPKKSNKLNEEKIPSIRQYLDTSKLLTFDSQFKINLNKKVKKQFSQKTSELFGNPVFPKDK